MDVDEDIAALDADLASIVWNSRAMLLRLREMGRGTVKLLREELHAAGKPTTAGYLLPVLEGFFEEVCARAIPGDREVLIEALEILKSRLTKAQVVVGQAAPAGKVS